MTEPILLDIAGALATRAATSLFELVKNKFSRSPEQEAVLEAANEQEPATVRRLAGQLAAIQYEDEEFFGQLVTEWQKLRNEAQADGGSVINQVSGNVTGKLIQARDISGGISM